MNKNKRHQDVLESELKSLKSKSNRLASIHSDLSDNFARKDTVLTSIVLLLTVFLIGITFISEQFVQETISFPPNTQKWAIGIASILIFGIELLLQKWDLKSLAASHREAVRFYFGILRKIRHLLDSNTVLTEELVNEIQEDYGRTQGLPKIPEAKFLKLKQKHLQKIAISRELEKTPFDSLKDIEKRLRESYTIES